MFYLYELQDCVGDYSGDTTIINAIVEAETRADAEKKIGAHFDARADAENWQHDGNLCGYMYPCTCEVPTMPDTADEFPCDDCKATCINGVNCHESGCPTERKLRRLQKEIDNFECDGHGGLTLMSETPEEYETWDEAFDAIPMFHVHYEVPDDSETPEVETPEVVEAQ